MLQNEAPNQAEAFEAQMRAHVNVWEIALRRMSLLALGLVVGIALGSFYYAMQTPVYQSNAQVLVIKKQPNAFPLTGTDPRMSYYEDYLSTHQVLIKSPVIIGRAVKKLQPQGLRSYAGLGDPTNAIIHSLAVSRELDKAAVSSNILNLSFHGIVSDECPTILNAIIDSYKDFLEETYKNVSDDTVDLITKARDVLQKDLAQKQDEYRTFRLNAPLLSRGKDGVSFPQEKLSSIESRRGSLLVREAEIQARLATIDKALKNGRDPAALLAMLPELSTSPIGEPSKRLSTGTPAGSTTLLTQEKLLTLLTQEKEMEDEFGPNYPPLQSLRKRIDFTRKYQDKEGLAREKNKDESPAESIDHYKQALQQELEDIQSFGQLLATRFQTQYDEARKVINDEIRDEISRGDIDRTLQLYQSIIKRLQEINLVKDFGGYDARTISPAGQGYRVEPKALPIFTASIFLGLLGGFGLAYLADRTDKSFRSPAEVRRRLGLPIVGHIPQIKPLSLDIEGDPETVAEQALLWAYHRPRSQEAESYRGVRTALYFSMHGKDHRVVQVTSPEMGDGKTTLAANLGISIAQSGKKTLLIDADLRRPRLHKVFGLSDQVGLASVIQGEAELKEAIQPGCVPNLSVIPCGPIPPNPAELLTSPRLKEILDAIRTEYDFIIVDTPPLLAVTDPCVVAPRVDGVLLTLRISKNGRPSAERAREILSTLGVTVLGVVVNGIERHHGVGAYGYGYGYGYGYSHYKYGQGYGYTDSYHNGKGGEGYYPDAMAEGAPPTNESQASAGNGKEGRSADQASSPADQKKKKRRRKSRSHHSRSNLFRRLLGLG